MTRVPTNHRRGVSTTGIVVAGGILCIAVAFAVLRSGGSETQIQSDVDLFEAVVGDFDVTIPASGEVVAGEQVELRSDVDGTATIIEIVDEGTAARVGDVLVRMDDKEVRERIESAEEAVVNARNLVETRTADLSITQKSRESSLAKSKVAVDQARLALLAWQEGEVVAKRNQLALALRTAEKDHKRLADKYEKSLELRERDFISQNDLEQDEIQMIRAEAQLSQARLDQDVYEKYMFTKDKQRKESDLQQAEEDLARVETRTAASVNSSESNLEAAKSNLESKIERLAKHREQLENCTVVATADGMVVYGTTIKGWDRDDSLRVGSKVSRNRLLVVLPNTSQMLGDVKVNEALSGHIKAGQPATIRMDAFQESVLSGVVQSIGVLAEDGGWRDPNRRDYSVLIHIENTSNLALKPSMRCQATILVETVTEALYVPIQSVHRNGRTTLVYVADGMRYKAVPVTLGRSSELYVEILGGIGAGDRVLLREPPLGTILNAEELSE